MLHGRVRPQQRVDVAGLAPLKFEKASEVPTRAGPADHGPTGSSARTKHRRLMRAFVVAGRCFRLVQEGAADQGIVDRLTPAQREAFEGLLLAVEPAADWVGVRLGRPPSLGLRTRHLARGSRRWTERENSPIESAST